MNIFITGTDTDVGKTFVTAGIAAVMQGLGYKTSIYKPVQTGCVEDDGVLISPDLQFAKIIDSNIFVKSTYNFVNPVAPSLACRLENIIINKNDILRDYMDLCNKSDFVLVEGAGGILAPVCHNFLVRDMITFLKLPVLIVARPDLGTINHTLLTIEAAKKANIEIIGVIISNYPENTDDIAIKTAPSIISEISGVNILGILPCITANINESVFPEILIEKVISSVNIQEIFKINIPKLSLK